MGYADSSMTPPSDAPPAGSSPRRRAPLWKKLVTAIVSPVLFIGLVELALAATGFERPLYAGLPPGVTTYWIPWSEPGAPDGFTRSFPRSYKNFPEEQPIFVAEKPPNGYRVFVLGESSVQGLPFEVGSFCDWLRIRLRAMLPERFVEVVNAGNPGWHAKEIRTLARESARHAPDLMIWMVGHNEMVPQNVLALREEHERPLWHAATSLVNGLRVRHALARFVPKFSLKRETFHDRKPDDFRPCYDAELPLLKRRFREATAGVVADCRAARIPLVLCTLTRNVRESPPSGSFFSPEVLADPARREAWERIYGEALEAIGRKDATSALAVLARAEAIDPSPARLHFARGQALEMLGETAEARASYFRALELDSCPMRAAPWVETAIREVAAETSTPLADVERMLDADSPLQIAGFDWVVDNVHPSLGGHERIAELLLSVMERKLGLALDHTLDPPREEARRAIGVDVYDTYFSSRATCLANLQLVVQSGRKDELWTKAMELCDEVLRVAPKDWEIVAARGVLEAIAGNADEARSILRRAMTEDDMVRLVHVYYFHAEPPFRRVLESTGIDWAAEESRLHPSGKTILDNRLRRARLR